MHSKAFNKLQGNERRCWFAPGTLFGCLFYPFLPYSCICCFTKAVMLSRQSVLAISISAGAISSAFAACHIPVLIPSFILNNGKRQFSLLPVLSFMGYVLFAIWRTRWATQVRSRRLFVDLYWTAGLFELLFAHFGVLIPVLGMGGDGDYNGFVNNISFELWQANAFLLFILAVNIWLLYFVIHRLWSLRRRIKGESELERTNRRQHDST